MADSSITKRALAAAMKQLMVRTPFSKISVGDICEQCEMSRKSFYYHFKDKYDLVNWIFYTEVVVPLSEQKHSGILDVLQEICQHLYDERDFYRRAFQISGQNSFPEYFREMMEPLLIKTAEVLFADSEDREFYLVFFAGSFITAIERWIQNPDCVPAQAFIQKARNCFICAAEKLVALYS